MKNILLFIHSLQGGGTAKNIVFIANNLDKRKYTSKIIVISNEAETPFDVKNIDIIYLNKRRFLNSTLKIIKLLIIERPSIVFSSVGQMNLFFGFLSPFFNKIKFIAREAFIISMAKKFYENKILNSKLLYSGGLGKMEQTVVLIDGMTIS